ncbi:hypothetical protein FF38_01465 [Lucilia cuprina]|uniref:Uncharacterized protein n=1 Tax=Lucilia cuprina TaxID=7375 RepID=A0A0L0BNA6_LUCCU|nr:hypothetical protein FF38_01465 [Lucilia cuprina]
MHTSKAASTHNLLLMMNSVMQFYIRENSKLILKEQDLVEIMKGKLKQSMVQLLFAVRPKEEVYLLQIWTRQYCYSYMSEKPELERASTRVRSPFEEYVAPQHRWALCSTSKNARPDSGGTVVWDLSEIMDRFPPFSIAFVLEPRKDNFLQAFEYAAIQQYY